MSLEPPLAGKSVPRAAACTLLPWQSKPRQRQRKLSSRKIYSDTLSHNISPPISLVMILVYPLATPVT